MNIFGFFAVVIICVTLLIIAWLAFKKGFTITHNHRDLTKERFDHPPQFIKEPEKPDNKALEKEINEQKMVKASMDAVIKSCNALMGIETEEVEDGRKE